MEREDDRAVLFGIVLKLSVLRRQVFLRNHVGIFDKQIKEENIWLQLSTQLNMLLF